jgi:hypothetical protein
MTDTLQVETPQYVLPKPKVEISKQEQIDWRPGTYYWQFLTGHKEAFSNTDIFFDKQGKLSLPKSELGYDFYYVAFGYVLEEHPKRWLDPSWVGFQDSLRMCALTPDGLNEMRTKLQASGYQIKEIPNGLGIIVEKVPIKAMVKDEAGSFKKDYIEGFAFFLDESKFQSPLDVLIVVDEIAKLHPETEGKLKKPIIEPILNRLLTKSLFAKENALNWQRALESYPQGQIPDYLKDIFEQTRTILNK